MYLDSFLPKEMIVVIVIWISVFVFAIFQMGLDPGRDTLSSLELESGSLYLSLSISRLIKAVRFIFHFPLALSLFPYFCCPHFASDFSMLFLRKVFASYSNSWACCIRHSWGAALHRKQAHTSYLPYFLHMRNFLLKFSPHKSA